MPLIRVFGGGSMSERLSDSDMQTAVDNLRWWKQQREQHQWKTDIALETHGGFSSGERCLRLQELFGGPLAVIWDTHHTWKLGDESATQTWDQLAAMIQHIHIKDSVSVPSERHPYSYCLLGKGEFPADDVFKVLHDNNYNGIVSLEWERKWHPYLDDLGTALQSLETSGWQSAANTPACS